MARVPGFALRLGANAARALRHGIAQLALPRGRWWIRLRLSSPLPELAPPVLFAREPTLSLLEALAVLDRARRDERVAGVVVRPLGPLGGLARAESLRRALLALREAGKPTVVWSERLGAEELLLASAASKVWLPESGSVDLVGLRFESFFLRGLLERLGVRADVVRVGEYKTAAEALTRDAMSSEQREQLGELADDLYRMLSAQLAEGRGLEAERVRSLVDRGPYGAAAARELGLIDGCLYPDELDEALLGLAPGTGEPDHMPIVEAAAYLVLHALDPGWRPWLRDLPHLAYVVAGGMIHRGRGLRGISSDSYRGLLERLRRDDRVRGLVLRVESPGGDAVASDLLWRSLRRLGRDKPVVASMGDVAASGGYFLAAGADAILAEPSTLTGSIGVVGGKLDLSRLYERIGVRKESVERGARAGMLAEERAFTPDERKAVREEMTLLYELFLERVAAGRRLSREEVHAAGQGRIWSGRRARELRLIDAHGGPLEALDEVKRRAGIGPSEPVLLEIHPRIPRIADLRSLLRFWRMDLP